MPVQTYTAEPEYERYSSSAEFERIMSAYLASIAARDPAAISMDPAAHHTDRKQS